MTKKPKKERVPVDAPAGAGLGTLGDLLRGLGEVAPGSADSAQPQAAVSPSGEHPATPAAVAPKKPGRVVLRVERKGRGGRTVTVLQGLSPEVREATARRLGRSLGCGAGVEGDLAVLQGDQRERAKVLLEGEGWRVVLG